MENRVVALEGIHNFRDYGGYSARDGARIKSGLLWRSGQHVHATEDDLASIAALDIRTVIDLRGDSERAEHPCARHPEFDAVVLFAPGETVMEEVGAPHVEAAKNVTTSAEAHEAMVRLYKTMPFRPKLVEVFQLYVDALANRDGASLLHCLAGKDRTGIAAALVHNLLGVHPDDAMADYLLTNTVPGQARRIEAGARTVRENFGRTMDDAAVRTLMSVHPEFLETAFAAILEKFGSVGAYAQAVLGVTPAKLARIEARLLA